MPVLPVPKRTGVELPISGGRRASAEDFGGGGDLGGKQIAQAATAYLAESEESEARKALVASSEIRADYARRLDAAAQNGEDLGKLKESLQNDLAKVGENFQTKRGADSLALYTSNTELMYDEQANAISVRRAYTEAQGQGQKLLNSVGAELQRDPTQVKNAEKTLSEFLGTFRNLRPEQRAELEDRWHKSVNMSSAIASARLNPDTTIARLKAGEWNLTPEQRAAGIDNAEQEKRALRADEAYRRGEEIRQRNERDDKARDKHFGMIINGGASRRAIMDDADLQPATREHLIVLMEARARSLTSQEKASDSTVVRDLWMRIHAPEGDPKRMLNGDAIFEQVKAGRINVTDANRLMADVSNQKDENNRAIGAKLTVLSTRFERAVNADPRTLAFTAPERAEIMNNYTARVLDRVAELRKANDAKGLRDLFDPTNKDGAASTTFMQQSIDEIAEKKRQGAQAAALAEDVVFPDGKTRRYSGTGSKTDMANWTEVSAVKTIKLKPESSPREFRGDLEANDQQLRSLRVFVNSENVQTSTDAWIKYARRVKELDGGR